MECPSCKRKIEKEEYCPRCGMNLIELNKLTIKAERYILKGKKYITQKDFKKAFKAFKIANSLYHSSIAEKGIITSLICLGSYQRALRVALKCGYLEKFTRSATCS